MLRNKLNCLFNKEELLFLLLIFSLFLNSHSIIREKNNKLSRSQKSPSSFAHSHRAITSHNPSGPSIGLRQIRQAAKSKVQWCFSLHNYLLMLTNGVTAVPFLGQDLCRNQSHINNFPGWFFSLLLFPLWAHGPGRVPSCRRAATLAGAADGPLSPRCRTPLPMLSAVPWIASTAKWTWVFRNCDGKSQQRPLHPQNWEGARKEEEGEGSWRQS